LDTADFLVLISHCLCLLVHHSGKVLEGGTLISGAVNLSVDSVDEDGFVVAAAPHHVFDIGVNLKELGVDIFSHVSLGIAARNEN